MITYVNMHVLREQKQILMLSHNRKGLQPFVDNYEKKKTSVASFYREKR